METQIVSIGKEVVKITLECIDAKKGLYRIIESMPICNDITKG